MKKIILLFFTLFLILGVNRNVYSQYNVQLQIFDPLPEVDFAAFAITNNLSGAPRILSITIEPEGAMVILEGRIEWQKDEGESYSQLYTFKTAPFTARNITNSDIGFGDIRIVENRANSSLTQENIDRGMPTGKYRMTVYLRDEHGAIKDTDQKEISFLNPSQTFVIRSPEANSDQNIGNVLAEWDNVVGATSYSVTANVRTSTTQGLEDALNSGTPLIDNKDVGNLNVVSLRQLLDRDWLAGQEIVLQVTANISGPGGGRELNSNIVNFFIQDPAGATGTFNQEILGMLELLSDITGRDLVTRFEEGQMDFSNMRITLSDGRIITQAELTTILNYLKTNPDNIVGVSFVNK